MYGSTQHERNPNMFRFRCCGWVNSSIYRYTVFLLLD